MIPNLARRQLHCKRALPRLHAFGISLASRDTEPNRAAFEKESLELRGDREVDGNPRAVAIHATSRTSTGHGQGKHAIPATYHTLLSAVRILVRSQSTSVCSVRCSSQGSHSHSNPAPTPNARLTSRAHTCDLRDTQRSDDSRCGNRRSTYMNNLRIDRVALPIASRR